MAECEAAAINPMDMVRIVRKTKTLFAESKASLVSSEGAAGKLSLLNKAKRIAANLELAINSYPFADIALEGIITRRVKEVFKKQSDQIKYKGLITLNTTLTDDDAKAMAILHEIGHFKLHFDELGEKPYMCFAQGSDSETERFDREADYFACALFALLDE
ncbi:MAG: ImmA/IrrE family metallo-endopeptidase [Oscillospiraceae bacterium]|jgi:hypothetical protein|nr:ImmA/IrrE family metallo-endopeptidase [Oscillospiraceae bacterium]